MLSRMPPPPAPRWTDGPAITEARVAAGLTQTALAALVGVTKVMISHVESGRCEPSVATLGRIAAALGVDPGPFIRTAPAITPTKPTVAA